jgi:hypothetical protein
MSGTFAGNPAADNRTGSALVLIMATAIQPGGLDSAATDLEKHRRRAAGWQQGRLPVGTRSRLVYTERWVDSVHAGLAGPFSLDQSRDCVLGIYSITALCGIGSRTAEQNEARKCNDFSNADLRLWCPVGD